MGKLCKILTVLSFVFMVAMVPVEAKASDFYAYESSTNQYTLDVKSGANITDALKEALESAAGTAEKPAIIKIPAGNYKINLVKLQKNYVTIDATGATITFIGSTSSGSYVIRGTDSAITGVKITGGTWDGAGLASIVFNFAGSDSTKNLSIENCVVKGSQDTNLKIQTGSNVSIKNCTFSGSNYGAIVETSSSVTFSNCTASGNTFGYALRNMKGSANELSDCYATANVTDGVQIKGSGTIVKITSGKYYANKKNGISMTTGTKVILKNADASDNDANGISPVGASGTTTVMTATNCIFNNNGRHGVAGDTYATINLTDCVANGNASNGFGLNKGCKSETGIVRCTANNNGASGIMVQEKSTCSKIVDCVANNNRKLGISVTDTGVTLENCQANNNAKHGFYISTVSTSGTVNTVKINKCVINANKENGIYLGEKKKVTITNTTINNNGQSGIESKATTLTVKGSGNKVIGNKKYGIAAMDGKMDITKATVQNNGKYGVYFVESGTSGSLTNSKIIGNMYGVVLNRGAQVSKINSNTIKDNKEYGVLCYSSKSGKKTTLKQCTKNTFNNPLAKEDIKSYGNKVKLPSGMNKVQKVKLAANVRAGKKKITGTATPKVKLTLKVANKSYKVTVKSNGSFSVKVAKLKKKAKINMTYSDKNKNKYTQSITLK